MDLQWCEQTVNTQERNKLDINILLKIIAANGICTIMPLAVTEAFMMVALTMSLALNLDNSWKGSGCFMRIWLEGFSEIQKAHNAVFSERLSQQYQPSSHLASGKGVTLALSGMGAKHNCHVFSGWIVMLMQWLLPFIWVLNHHGCRNYRLGGQIKQLSPDHRNGLAFHQQQLFMLLSCKRWFYVVLVPLFVNSMN